jgi:hypothetical protein
MGTPPTPELLAQRIDRTLASLLFRAWTEGRRLDG